MRYSYLAAIVCLIMSLVISGCGGGGGDGSARGDGEIDPLVTYHTTEGMHLDQNVTVGSAVTLDGGFASIPDGGLISYSWKFVEMPTGSAAVLSSSSTVRPTFVVDLDGEYILELTVSNGSLSDVYSPITITVAIANSAPVANAGNDQNVTVGGTVTLNGSGSSDADNDLLSYDWSFTSIPMDSNTTLFDSTAASPTFDADEEGNYILSLTVNDGTVTSAADNVTITAAIANSAPVANAGNDQNVTVGSTVTLNGSGSSDADNDLLSYDWSFTSIPMDSNATLSDSTAALPTFDADEEGNYVLSLTVDDGTVTSTADNVTVTAAISTPLFVLADTGQNTCWDIFGTEINCAGTGQDGEFDINPLTNTNNGNGTITDNITNLIWQSSSSNYLSWYGARSYCEDLTLGSSSNWRVPSIHELISHADYGNNILIQRPYWSATSVANSSSHAWVTSTDFTQVYFNLKIADNPIVRCVQGDAPPAADFTDNGDGTVTDNLTDLIFQQSDDGIAGNWQQSLTYCNSLTLGGSSNWRLPNIKELASIIDYSRYVPSVDTAFFDALSSKYWSSTSFPDGPTGALYVEFYSGSIFGASKWDNNYCRCVR